MEFRDRQTNRAWERERHECVEFRQRQTELEKEREMNVWRSERQTDRQTVRT